MSGQLSLFPAGDDLEAKKQSTDGEMNSLDEAFAVHRRFRDARSFIRMMQYIAGFSRYSALNGFLLYLQNPNASRVATAGTWLKQHGRRLRHDAKPMVILAPMSPVRFLYDISDTEGKPIPEHRVAGLDGIETFSQQNLDLTIQNALHHGIGIRSASRIQGTEAIRLTYDTRKAYEELDLEAEAKYLVVLEARAAFEERYISLTEHLGHIFCGHLGIDTLAWWPDRSGIDQDRAVIEARTVAYLVCCRRGMELDSTYILMGREAPFEELPLISLHSVFHSTHYIEQMGRGEWEQPKKQSRYQQ